MWMLLLSCVARQGPVTGPPPPRTFADLPEPEQRALLLEAGREIYRSGAGGAPPCAVCHRVDGSGIPGAFPPLRPDRPWFSDCAVAQAQVVDGVFGALVVDGQAYNGVMPPVGDRLDAYQLAAVITYARSLADPAGTVALCLPTGLP
jgi:mono/diheme cytochrome c family protein